MKQRKIPLRKCTGCLEMKNKKELIRVVKTDSDSGMMVFSLDFKGKKSGRGAYICPNADCLAKAHKQKGLERSFKQVVPSEIYEELQGVLAENQGVLNGP